VQNAAKAEIKGLEVDSRLQVSDSLGVSGAFSYIDFEFASFPFAGCTEQQLNGFRQTGFDAGTAQVNSGDTLSGATTRLLSSAATLQNCSLAGVNNLAGKTTEQVPEFTLQFALDHRASFSNGFSLDTLLDVVWFDEQYRQTDLDPETLHESFSKTNLSLTLAKDDAPWSLALIVRNLFDKHTYSYANDTPLTSGARQMIVDKPRQAFVQFIYNL
jgi:outer membrane receptor protein involved in Fe transport